MGLLLIVCILIVFVLVNNKKSKKTEKSFPSHPFAEYNQTEEHTVWSTEGEKGVEGKKGDEGRASLEGEKGDEGRKGLEGAPVSTSTSPSLAHPPTQPPLLSFTSHDIVRGLIMNEILTRPVQRKFPR